MVDQSLLTPDVRALEGSESPPVTVIVTEQAVHRAAETFGCEPPAHLAPGDPVPGYAFAALDPTSGTPEVPELLPASVLVSNEWTFERDLLLDEELSAVRRIESFGERFGGRLGYSIQVRLAVELRDPAGALVARSVTTLSYYDPAVPLGESAGD